MDIMNAEGPSFIPFTQLIRKATNQSPVHLSTREEAWLVKDNKVVYSPNGFSSLGNESNLPFHSLKRAVFTILLPCTEILVVNSAACKLLNFSSEELCSMELQSLVHDQYKYKLLPISEFQLNDGDQNVNKKEKMIELVSKDGDVISASIYFKKIDAPNRCLAIVEPIDRKTGVLTVDNNGRILTCDDDATSIFQYDASDLIGSDIRTIIPNICLDPDGEYKCDVSYKQRITGRNKNGSVFPLCLVISKNCVTHAGWQVVVWLFLNLSGLIILNGDLRISNCNHQFMKLLFGVTRDNVLNQKITKLIPSFCDDIRQMNNDVCTTYQSGNSESPRWEKKKCKLGYTNTMKGKKTKQYDPKSFIDTTSLNGRNNSFIVFSDHYRSWNKCDCGRRKLFKESNTSLRLSKSDFDIPLGCKLSDESAYDKLGSARERWMNSDIIGDTEKFISEELTLRTKQKNGDDCFNYKHLGLKEGYFYGSGKHWDGTDISIYYKVKIISFGDKLFYCIWITRNPTEINDGSPYLPETTVTASSSVISSSMDDSVTKGSSYNDELTRLSSASILSQSDEILTRGEYSEHYTNIEQIGKGAFGYVKLAFRHSDGLLVVTKFIKKHKINVQSWVFDPKWNVRIPLEISLLCNLKHPNIIQVLDVFHNDSFFQLVMKKHGAGMDLFEFIERKPSSDERLNSYIFRQIISAVQYLDSIGVLHRDIKDENVIINEKFEVKLIDFGSAVFRPPGKMFSVFYGTVEYCSPEVLQGNTYRGPELEIWALGVTLYVLSFGENPFYDVQETIKGQFTIPVAISSYLYDLLHKMLDKDVNSRITIGRVAVHPWITQPVDIDKYRFEDVVHCSAAEAEPPQYVTEFTFDKKYVNSNILDGDGDRTMASSNSFCSLQTTENTENFDHYEENLQDFEGDFLSDDTVFKSSTPLSSGSSRNRGDLTKSAGALHRVCDPSINFKNDRFQCNKFIRKRFSLDLNILKRLSSNNKCSDSDCSLGAMNSRKHFNEKLELELISDLDEMNLVTDESKRKKNDMYDSDSGDTGGCFVSYDSTRERTVSHETEESNVTAYPEFYDTSDSRSFDGEDSECFWDAENEKFRSSDNY